MGTADVCGISWSDCGGPSCLDRVLKLLCWAYESVSAFGRFCVAAVLGCLTFCQVFMPCVCWVRSGCIGAWMRCPLLQCAGSSCCDNCVCYACYTPRPLKVVLIMCFNNE